MRFTTTASVAVGVLFAASAADAGITKIKFEILDTTDPTRSSGDPTFDFSVFHTSDAVGGQGGTIKARFVGEIIAEWDDMGTSANFDDGDTLTITSFSGDLLTPDGSGGFLQGGSGPPPEISLAGGPQVLTLQSAPDSGSSSGLGVFLKGALSLSIDEDFDGVADGTVNFDFDAQEFNDLANQFFVGPTDPSQPATAGFSLGLWGAGPNSNSLFNDSGNLGVDIFAEGEIIPLPHPAALAGAGLAGLMGIRRRRSRDGQGAAALDHEG